MGSVCECERGAAVKIDVNWISDLGAVLDGIECRIDPPEWLREKLGATG